MSHRNSVAALVAAMVVGSSLATLAASLDTPSPSAGPAAKIQVAVMFVHVPRGMIHQDVRGPLDVSIEQAFGFRTAFDLLPHPNAFVGFAPSATFRIQPLSSSQNPSREFDFLLRFGVRAPLGDRAGVYGYLAPGYSFIGVMGLIPVSQGPVIGVHGGGRFDVTGRIFVAAELGYQLGFQRGSSDYPPLEVRSSTELLQIAIGVGLRI